MAKLHLCADEAKIQDSLVEVPPLPPQKNTGMTPKLGLGGQHQLYNASVACHLAFTWLRDAEMRSLSPSKKDVEPLPETLDLNNLPKEFLEGLSSCRWPARCHTVESPNQPNVSFFIDGSHTQTSVKACCEWFNSASRKDALRVLLFNCAHDRNPFKLLSPISSLKPSFQHVFSAPFDWDRPRLHDPLSLTELAEEVNQTLPTSEKMATFQAEGDTWQHTVLTSWQVLTHENGAKTIGECDRKESVAKAIEQIHEIAAANPDKQVDVLVCGSLYLAGNTLAALNVTV